MKIPITVKLSKNHSGRGVFANEPLTPGMVIEQCPVILLPDSDMELLHGTVLDSYILPWKNKIYAFPLGFANFSQRSKNPNVKFVPDIRQKMLNVTVIKSVAAGEELYIEDMWEGKKEIHLTTQQKCTTEFLTDFPFELGESPTLHIRGLIATRDIPNNTVIIRCPVILFPMKDEDNVNESVLGKYYFEWTYTQDAFCLGYGALLNHSYTPNVYYGRNYKTDTIIFRTLKAIKKGEELFVNYNGYDEEEKDLPVDPEYIDYDEHHKGL